MTNQCKWRQRLNLPYRVEYDCRAGKEALGSKGIMALQVGDSWSIRKRQYKHPTGQEYKDIKTFDNKQDAVKFVRRYIKLK